ncbi:MAG: PAS-domain containing protein [Magnetovibrio sp.]|nr:PAS-domain containing protein [Magnetovibrio sp.]
MVLAEQSTKREQLKLLQAALDHINQGFTMFDHDLRMVGWNKRFAELLGFPEHLIKTGTPFSDFMRFNAERGEYGEGDVEQLVAQRVERARTFSPRTMISKRPSGEVISVRDTPLPSGGFVTIYTDVTDQRQREEVLAQAVTKRTSALRDSEQRLRLITDAVPALIAHIDKQTCYTFANQRYATWFGFTVENILGRPMKLVIEDGLYQELLPNTLQALSGTETTYEYSRKGPDGRYAEMRSTLLPDFDENGEVRGCFVLSIDITEQKQS